MPEEPGSFHDINRPGRVQPTPTSRPIIVGHRPSMPDPMVTRQPADRVEEMPPKPPEPFLPPTSTLIDGISAPSKTHPASPHLDSIKARPLQPTHANTMNHSPHHAKPAHHPEAPMMDMLKPEPRPEHEDSSDNSEAEVRPSPRSGNPDNYHIQWWAPVGLLLVIAIALYLAVDSGLINTGINLPYHFFKQDSSTPNQ